MRAIALLVEDTSLCFIIVNTREYSSTLFINVLHVLTRSGHRRAYENRVELGYNVVKGTEYFVLL